MTLYNLKSRCYQPQDDCEQQAPLREVLDFIASGGLSGGDTNLFRPLDPRLLPTGLEGHSRLSKGGKAEP